MYHYIGALMPSAQAKPAILSLYLFDSDCLAQGDKRTTTVR